MFCVGNHRKLKGGIQLTTQEYDVKIGNGELFQNILSLLFFHSYINMLLYSVYTVLDLAIGKISKDMLA